jgi:hypothetical protein
MRVERLSAWEQRILILILALAPDSEFDALRFGPQNSTFVPRLTAASLQYE